MSMKFSEEKRESWENKRREAISEMWRWNDSVKKVFNELMINIQREINGEADWLSWKRNDSVL